jgi:hypothetical protein
LEGYEHAAATTPAEKGKVVISHAMPEDLWALLFDVRRSVRYHDRRCAFFEQLHRVTSVLTILLAGSVLFEIARPGDTAPWLVALSVAAAILAASDTVIGFAARAGLHRSLKQRFILLETSILARSGSLADHQRVRLGIEHDEPPVYRALDLLCYNEMLRAEGCPTDGEGAVRPSRLTSWQRLTSQWWRWADLSQE